MSGSGTGGLSGSGSGGGSSSSALNESGNTSTLSHGLGLGLGLGLGEAPQLLNRSRFGDLCSRDLAARRAAGNNLLKYVSSLRGGPRARILLFKVSLIFALQAQIVQERCEDFIVLAFTRTGFKVLRRFFAFYSLFRSFRSLGFVYFFLILITTSSYNFF